MCVSVDMQALILIYEVSSTSIFTVYLPVVVSKM